VASLVGVKLPDVALTATNGEQINLSKMPSKLVLFVYPYTGVPGIPDPEGWDDIPGAHGSTPQALAFSYRFAEFERRDVKVFGVSLQSSEWQSEFVKRTQLAFPLLSDEKATFCTALELETFQAGNTNYLTRRTFIVEHGIITHDFYPVIKPATNADDVLKVLQQ
jgi:peroxiredoxin